MIPSDPMVPAPRLINLTRSLQAPGVAWPDLIYLALGIALTLCLRGYQFGQSNHAVYLPPALHYLDPHLLRSDWFTTATLQYHGPFTLLSAACLRLGIIQPVFLSGYLALLFLFHLAWLRLTTLLGGSRQTYLLSVGFYYLSAAGLGLGMYQFLQDGAFLPSNLANIALLWGIYFLAASRPLPAAIALGLAGLFHLNHALIALALWIAFSAWSLYAHRYPAARASAHRFAEPASGSLPQRPLAALGISIPSARLTPTAILAAFIAFTIVPTLPAILAKTDALPLPAFLDLYVRLRHPHHYDPSSWPWYLWLAFLWPLPLAASGFLRPHFRVPLDPLTPPTPRANIAAIFLFFLALQLLALLLAGVFYISESFVQLSLYRFSIYVKLLSCIAAAHLLWDRFLLPRRTRPFVACLPLGTMLALCLATLLLRQTAPANFWPLPRDDQDYLALCDWARHNTPVDAIFLVPPDEQSFRLHAQRAIVINFKGVPQLSAELAEWRRRLETVLAMDNLLDLPPGFAPTARAIRQRYDALPPAHLLRVAHQFNAAYIITAHPLRHPALRPLHTQGPYCLYPTPPHPETRSP